MPPSPQTAGKHLRALRESFDQEPVAPVTKENYTKCSRKVIVPAPEASVVGVLVLGAIAIHMVTKPSPTQAGTKCVLFHCGVCGKLVHWTSKCPYSQQSAPQPPAQVPAPNPLGSPYLHEPNAMGTGCTEGCPACRWARNMEEIEAVLGS